MRETPTGTQQEEADVLTERDRIDRLSRVRALVFGSLDGLIVPLGVVSGVAGGIGDSRAVIVAGIAEAFAGALSMAAGEFIAGRSEAQVQQTEVRKELAEMRDAPKYEFDELVHMYAQEGMRSEDAKLLVATLARYPGVYEKAMVAQELGIPTLEPETAKISAAMTIGVSYIVGSIVPLVAYFFFPDPSRVASFARPDIRCAHGGRHYQRQARQHEPRAEHRGNRDRRRVSAGGGYVLGTLLPHLLGY